MEKLNFLNIGCGDNFLKNWYNIDFNSDNEFVIPHNLDTGVPFSSNSFSVVYASHVIEHFSLEKGLFLLGECHRVLVAGGVLRIAIPDLEKIARNYINCLDDVSNEPNSIIKIRNHEWAIIELIDQLVRRKQGGQMKKFLGRQNLENEDFVYSRIGFEGKNLRRQLLKKHLNNDSTNDNGLIIYKLAKKINELFLKIRLKVAFKLLGKYSYSDFTEWKFLKTGENHLWMYDRISIVRYLTSIGFEDIRIVKANESQIPNWQEYNLDIYDSKVRKPDSLFVEAKKM